MLPEGFKWQKALPADQQPTVIAFNDIYVCWLQERTDGSWFVYLDRHLQIVGGPLAPIRECASYESGVRGCELWVARHQERLRREAAALAEARDSKRRRY